MVWVEEVVVAVITENAVAEAVVAETKSGEGTPVPVTNCPLIRDTAVPKPVIVVLDARVAAWVVKVPAET
jgi:hypothetical protein